MEKPKYTIKTKQLGVRGAMASIFRDGVHIKTLGPIQAVGTGDTDKARALRAARERVFEYKQMDSIGYKHHNPRQAAMLFRSRAAAKAYAIAHGAKRYSITKVRNA